MTQREGEMKVRHLRLATGLFFAAMAVLLFLRNEIAPELAAKFRDHRLALGAWFALVLAGWNAVRWYAEWAAERRPRRANPLAVKVLPTPDEPPPPTPELQFDARPREEPSRNGDGK
jgi:cyanate permease